MKTRRVRVSFEKTIEITLYAPADMSLDQIEELARDEAASGLRGWDEPDWEVFVGRGEDIDIPDSECAKGPPNKYGFRNIIEGSRLRAEDVLTVSDNREAIVAPEDATWWMADNNNHEDK